MATSTMKKQQWTLTDEHRALIPAWNQRWIDEVIMRTRPMDDDDRRITIEAIHGIYEAAGLEHRDLRIVFVSSPLMAAVVAGDAARDLIDHRESIDGFNFSLAFAKSGFVPQLRAKRTRPRN